MNSFVPEQSVFVHGLNGNSQGVKATLLRRLYPTMHIPDFPGSLAERMQRLQGVIGAQDGWTLVGSSLGGLMVAMFTCQHPDQVRKQVLLAPALSWSGFTQPLPSPILTPTVIYHGSQDKIVPLEPVRQVASQVFLKLSFNMVDDDHGLYQTVHKLDWQEVLS